MLNKTLWDYIQQECLFFNNNILNWVLLLHMTWIVCTILIKVNSPYSSQPIIILFACIISMPQGFTKLHSYLVIVQSLLNSFHLFGLWYPKLRIGQITVSIDLGLRGTEGDGGVNKALGNYCSKQWGFHSWAFAAAHLPTCRVSDPYQCGNGLALPRPTTSSWHRSRRLSAVLRMLLPSMVECSRKLTSKASSKIMLIETNGGEKETSTALPPAKELMWFPRLRAKNVAFKAALEAFNLPVTSAVDH